MSDHGHPTSRELHQAAAFERARLRELQRHERQVREREKSRVLAHMMPLKVRYDETGFAPGCTL